MDRAELEDATRRTLDKLKVTRQTCEGSPSEDMQKRLRESLQQTLAELPPADAGRMLERLREKLVTEAKERQERLETLEATSHKLESENTALRREKEDLTRQLATSSSGSPPTTRSSTGGLDRVRVALRRVSDGGALTEGSVNLSHEDIQLMELIKTLYQFAVDVSTTVQRFVVFADQEHGDTVASEFAKEVRKRFINCVENRAGSLAELNDVLSRSRRFIPALNEAHMLSIRAGTKTILAGLDPQPVADGHRGAIGGVKYDQAWRALSNAHADLTALSSAERWETYFQPTFKTELRRLFEGKPPKTGGSVQIP